MTETLTYTGLSLAGEPCQLVARAGRVVALRQLAQAGAAVGAETRTGAGAGSGTGADAGTNTNTNTNTNTAAERIVHADGLHLSGGYVDLHGHGAQGVSYDDAEASDLTRALALHQAHGTRLMLLSLVSAPLSALTARLHSLRSHIAGLPAVAGIHLEGPFLAPARRGAHAASALAEPTPAAVDALLAAGEGLLRQVTIAPELPGAFEAINRFVEAGVMVAIGHTDADYETAARAFDHGASLLTHAYNAMPGMNHRAPGPLGAALERSHVTLEVIADGIHVHPIVVRTLFNAAPGRVALITDAMSATGLGDGSYQLGGLAVTVRDGRPVLSGTDTLAGSTLTMDRAVQLAVAAGVPVADALRAASHTPAAAIGVAAPAVAVGAKLSEILVVDAAGLPATLPMGGAQ